MILLTPMSITFDKVVYTSRARPLLSGGHKPDIGATPVRPSLPPGIHKKQHSSDNIVSFLATVGNKYISRGDASNNTRYVYD